MIGHDVRIWRLSLWWFSGKFPGGSIPLKPFVLGWTPFVPYSWRLIWWRFCVAWLVPGWDKPRAMKRQERRQYERKLLRGKTISVPNRRG